MTILGFKKKKSSDLCLYIQYSVKLNAVNLWKTFYSTNTPFLYKIFLTPKKISYAKYVHNKTQCSSFFFQWIKPHLKKKEIYS